MLVNRPRCLVLKTLQQLLPSSGPLHYTAVVLGEWWRGLGEKGGGGRGRGGGLTLARYDTRSFVIVCSTTVDTLGLQGPKQKTGKVNTLVRVT